MNPHAPHADAQSLADAFARQVERWALARGAAAADARIARDAAAALSLATADGHVCVSLDELPGTPRAALLASGVVGTHLAPGAMPLVLDGDDRLYLHRDFDHERALARRLMHSARAPLHIGDALPRLRALLGALFAGARDNADWQAVAAALALRGRLAIVSGGPGTGKTSTLVKLLACLAELEPDARVALAAPTGKAAARMAEAIGEQAAALPEHLRQRLPTEAFTVHRLLGAGPKGLAHDARRPLAIDTLVVDEASMLDLALARRLLDAVPLSARIVLLGDKDQLAAVESGAVFAELGVDPSLSAACTHDIAALTGIDAAVLAPPPAAQPSALRDAVVWFTRNYRFGDESGIGRLARHVNAGDAEAALAQLRAGDGVAWLDDPSAAPSPAALQQMIDGYAPYVDAVRHGAADVAAVGQAFARFRVLCAHRDGPRGALAMNAALERRLAGDGNPWYPGRPVLVQRNDAALKLFNGDIGIALPDSNGALMVHFALPGGGWRALPPVRLPAHESAFAMTVHKAQGSEFEQVLLLLPSLPSRVLTRELVYTALTRARDRVVICGSEAALRAAIAIRTLRRSGLLARLRECAG